MDGWHGADLAGVDGAGGRDPACGGEGAVATAAASQHWHFSSSRGGGGGGEGGRRRKERKEVKKTRKKTRNVRKIRKMIKMIQMMTPIVKKLAMILMNSLT